MDAPEILGISPEESYQPLHPQFFHRPPRYRYGGPCFAKLPGEVLSEASRLDTPRTVEIPQSFRHRRRDLQPW